MAISRRKIAYSRAAVTSSHSAIITMSRFRISEIFMIFLPICYKKLDTSRKLCYN